jgi:redox-sensitive bicupin YhaK (pirin superfamily)
MSAGSGVIHSEFNASNTQTTHFLQVWLVPSTHDVEPSYQQFAYAPSEKRGALRLIAGPDRNTTPPSAFIHQDARMYASVLGPGESITHRVAQGRHAWVQCATGNIKVNGLSLKEGDGLAVSEESELSLQGAGASGGELLLFDLA